MAMNSDPNSSTMTSIMGMYNTAKDKWDQSGGNEALSRVSASIPDSTKNMVGTMFKREHFRGVGVFFGIGEERPYYVEKTPSLLIERLRHNVTFFYLNYMAIAGVMFFLMMLMSPSTIIGLVLLGALWMWFVRASQDGTLRIGTVLAVPQKTATIAIGIFSLLFLMWLLKSIFWWAIGSAGFLVGVHALLRDASMHKDLDDAMAMEGDLNMNYGEESAFLGGNHGV